MYLFLLHSMQNNCKLTLTYFFTLINYTHTQTLEIPATTTMKSLSCLSLIKTRLKEAKRSDQKASQIKYSGLK